MKIEMKGTGMGTPDLQTSLFFGASRAGKTHLCATFPRVAWFGAAREGGYETIRYMDPALFYEPGRAPLIYAVTSMAELHNHLTKDVLPLVQRGEVRTIVLELSFYAADIIDALKPGAGKNGWVPYETLIGHIRYLDKLVKNTPGLRLVYNTLAASGDSGKTPGGVLVPGQAVAKEIPAMCHLIGYLRGFEADGKVVRALHLQPFENFTAGHRYGGRLPPIIRDPSYRKIEGLLDGSLTADAAGNVAVPQARTVLRPLGRIGAE